MVQVARGGWKNETAMMNPGPPRLGPEPFIEESRVVEDVHHLRLMALLHELVREKGNRGAASALGLDPRTVASCVKAGRLTWRVREALERGL